MSTSVHPPAPHVAAGLADLEVGDVLLMLGHGPLSQLIAWCGDSIYSHAALAADGGDLIEAAAEGVRRYPLAQRIVDADNYYFIDAFRPLAKDGSPLDEADRACVLAHAQSLLGVPYPLDQLATLGVILAVRGKWPQHWLARIVVREALDHLIGDDPSHMVCSEVVYRSFAECDAQPPGRLAPLIVLEARGTEPFPPIDWQALWDEVWPLLHPPRQAALGAVSGQVAAVSARYNAVGDAEPAQDAASAMIVSDAEIAAKVAQARAGLGIADVVLPKTASDDGTVLREAARDATPTPIAHPNPKLVTPLDLASTPSHTVLGRLMQAPMQPAGTQPTG